MQHRPVSAGLHIAPACCCLLDANGVVVTPCTAHSRPSATLSVCPGCGEPMQGHYCGTCERTTRPELIEDREP